MNRYLGHCTNSLTLKGGGSARKETEGPTAQPGFASSLPGVLDKGISSLDDSDGGGHSNSTDTSTAWCYMTCTLLSMAHKVTLHSSKPPYEIGLLVSSFHG